MEAMPSKRLYGGSRADFIPDAFKSKVYEQIAEFTLELYSIPLSSIGMLHFEGDSPSSVDVGQIYDQHYRVAPYGPFTDSFEFYHTRWRLLNEFYKTKEAPTDVANVREDATMPTALQHLIDQRTAAGPFFLVHRDYQINNILFDDEYNITALLDWSGCQTVPLESFATRPSKMIPDADKFIDATWGPLAGGPELRSQWKIRRELFLRILKSVIAERKIEDGDLLYDMMRSGRPFFASRLDSDGIVGVRQWLPRNEFERFVPKRGVSLSNFSTASAYD